METKYTKGPWEVGKDGYGSSDYIYCDDSSGSAVAKVNLEFTMIPKEQVEANKKLIAAAPELLEALKELNEAIDDYWNYGKTDALAKAICDRQKKCFQVIIKATE